MGNIPATPFFPKVRLHSVLASEEEEDEFEDPVERMLKKTGCLEKHYSVQVSYLNTYASI